MKVIFALCSGQRSHYSEYSLLLLLSVSRRGSSGFLHAGLFVRGNVDLELLVTMTGADFFPTDRTGFGSLPVLVAFVTFQKGFLREGGWTLWAPERLLRLRTISLVLFALVERGVHLFPAAFLLLQEVLSAVGT